MKNKGLLIAGGLGITAMIAYRSWAKKSSIKFFQYVVSGVKFNVKNILNPEVIFAVKVFNPNTSSVPVESVFGNILHDNTTVASFRTDGRVNIAGGEETTVNVTARINALTVLSKIITQAKVNSVTVDGIIKTPLFQMPINKVVTLSSVSGTDDEIGMSFKEWRNKHSVLPKKKKNFFSYLKARKQGFLQPSVPAVPETVLPAPSTAS